jgi:MFS transporter, MCT family, solute carrier family 16 (monocarboxylic acid transporters), member 3
MSTTTETELTTRMTHAASFDRHEDETSTGSLVAGEPEPDSSNVTSAIPDGGYGWIIVLSCSWLTFVGFGLSGAWGVIQAALLESSLNGTPTSTVTFIGSLGVALVVALSLLGNSLVRVIGARMAAILGVTLLGLGEIASGWTTSNVGGLFGTSGVLVGVGTCLCYNISNSLPTQYFSGKLGLANGIIKLGGGVGSTVLSITLELLIRRFGIPWMFRVLGLVTLATGLPAAWFIKERSPSTNAAFIDLSIFRNLPSVAIFLASAIGTFALFIPPYFIPLFARSAGLSSKTGAGLVAGFNAAASAGRFGAGPVCDWMGPLNTFFIAMALNAISVLAIWTISSSIGTLVLFAILNGIANGAFFTIVPTVVASMVGPGLAAVAMSMNVTGWTAGYLLGTPIAGYLLEATGADKAKSVGPYRPAILYAGVIAFVSSAFVLLARLKLDRKMARRM